MRRLVEGVIENKEAILAGAIAAGVVIVLVIAAIVRWIQGDK